MITKALPIGPRSSSLSSGSIASLICFWIVRSAASDWFVDLPGSTLSDLGCGVLEFLEHLLAFGIVDGRIVAHQHRDFDESSSRW